MFGLVQDKTAYAGSIVVLLEDDNTIKNRNIPITEADTSSLIQKYTNRIYTLFAQKNKSLEQINEIIGCPEVIVFVTNQINKRIFDKISMIGG
jgi:hypothetical protein